MKQTAACLLILTLLLSCVAIFTACGKGESDPSQGADKPATDRISPTEDEEDDADQSKDEPSDGGGKTDSKEERPTNVWDGTVDTAWYEKSKQNFQIGTAAQLAGLAKIVNQLDSTKTNASPPTINVTLTADLDLAGLEWTPIGVEKECKAIGTFDGAGYTVSGFRITDGETEPGYIGLFGYCYFDVKNLGVEDFTIHTTTERKAYVGGLAGYTIASVTDCYATGAVNAACFGTNTVSAGGFAGRINTTVEGCYATGNVTVAAQGGYAAGGFCGSVGGTLTDCYRADTQTFWIMQQGATHHTANNESGTVASLAVIETAEFHKTTLGWDEKVWSLADGERPTLKQTN